MQEPLDDRIAAGDDREEGFGFSGPLASGLTRPASVGTNVALPVGPVVDIVDDTFTLDEGDTLFGNVFDDNGNGPDRAPEGTDAVVVSVDVAPTIGESGFFEAFYSSGLAVFIDPEGAIEIYADDGFDILAAGETVTETLTYTASVSGVRVPGVFPSDINLSDEAAFDRLLIEGAATGDFSGIGVSGVVSADVGGPAGLVVGSYLSDAAQAENAGRADIVALTQDDGESGASRLSGTVDLGAVSAGTFTGSDDNHLFGQSVASRDLDGDGFGDLIIGVPRDDAAGDDSGAVEVVLSNGTNLFSAAANGAPQSFMINGGGARDYAGLAVDGAADFNGDGVGDVVVASWPADPGGRAEAGEISVVFGQSGTPTDVLLAAASSSEAITFEGIAAGDRAGVAISSAGDVNGDGLSDLLIGATGAGEGGAAYLVYGGVSVDGGALSEADVIITGAADSDLGRAVAIAGDVNGDGANDLIVGAPEQEGGRGAAHVVFGGSSLIGGVDVTTLDGSNGFTVIGADAGGRAGLSVAGAGDINNDGLDDLLIGAPREGETDAGAAYVVYGRQGGFPAVIDLGALAAADGFRIGGLEERSFLGWDVAGLGDADGDGVDDLAVTAFGHDANRGLTAVVYGRGSVGSETGSATVTVTVEGLNDAPFAVDDTGGTDENTPIVVDVLANDGDVDTGDSLIVPDVEGASTAASVEIDENGAVVFDPSGAFDSLRDGESVSETFGYTIADESGATATATATILVAGVNDAPVAVDDSHIVEEGDFLSIDPADNDIDAEGGTLTVTDFDDSGSIGSVFFDEGGGLLYDPGFVSLFGGDTETDSFTYTVTDDVGATDEGEVVITITAGSSFVTAGGGTGGGEATTGEGAPGASGNGGGLSGGSVARLFGIVAELLQNGADTGLNGSALAHNTNVRSLSPPPSDSASSTGLDAGESGTKEPPFGETIMSGNIGSTNEGDLVFQSAPLSTPAPIAFNLAFPVISPTFDTFGEFGNIFSPILGFPDEQIEELVGRGDDGALDLVFFGGAGNDNINGQDTDDVIFGDDGSDFLSGGAGGDLLIGDDGYAFLQENDLFGFGGSSPATGGSNSSDGSDIAVFKPDALFGDAPYSAPVGPVELIVDDPIF